MKPKAPTDGLNITPPQVIANVEAAKANKRPTRPRRTKGEVLTAKEVATKAERAALDRPLQEIINREAQEMVDPDAWQETDEMKLVNYHYGHAINYLCLLRDDALKQEGASAFAVRRLERVMLESIKALQMVVNSTAPGAGVARDALERMAQGFQRATWAREQARKPGRKAEKRGHYSPAFKEWCERLVNLVNTAHFERQTTYRGTKLPAAPFGWLDSGTPEGATLRDEWLAALKKIAPAEYRDTGLEEWGRWGSRSKDAMKRHFPNLWDHFHMMLLEWRAENQPPAAPDRVQELSWTFASKRS